MTSKQQVSLATKIVVSIFSGVLLGLSQPLYINGLVDTTEQHYLGLFAFVAYVPLFFVLASETLKRCFGLSVLAITVHHIIVLYWIYLALNVHGHIQPLPASLITVLLALVLALMGAVF